VVENQDGGYKVTAQGTDRTFNVVDGAGHSAQPHQRVQQGGSTSAHEPDLGTEASGDFNVA
jgi:hypothetical protein